MESSRAQTWELDFRVQACPSPTPWTNRMTPGKSLQLPECEFSDRQIRITTKPTIQGHCEDNGKTSKVGSTAQSVFLVRHKVWRLLPLLLSLSLCLPFPLLLPARWWLSSIPMGERAFLNV